MLYHARLYALALLLTALSTGLAQAQTAVALAGILGSKALLVVNGSAKLVGLISGVVRFAQSGFIYHYAFAMILGVLAMIITFITLK